MVGKVLIILLKIISISCWNKGVAPNRHCKQPHCQMRPIKPCFAFIQFALRFMNLQYAAALRIKNIFCTRCVTQKQVMSLRGKLPLIAPGYATETCYSGGKQYICNFLTQFNRPGNPDNFFSKRASQRDSRLIELLPASKSTHPQNRFLFPLRQFIQIHFLKIDSFFAQHILLNLHSSGLPK